MYPTLQVFSPLSRLFSTNGIFSEDSFSFEGRTLLFPFTLLRVRPEARNRIRKAYVDLWSWGMRRSRTASTTAGRTASISTKYWSTTRILTT